MKSILKKSGLETRAKRKKVQAHPMLRADWWLALASQYQDAYRGLATTEEQLPGIKVFWPRYHALGHSVELVLKGFLARKGITEADLVAIGHNIRPLLKKATSCGLILTRSQRAWIARLDDIHAEHWARYPKKHSAPTLKIGQFEPAVDALFRAVREQTGPWVPMVKI